MNTSFVEYPNLPAGDVALTAISSTYKDVIESLHQLNIETLLIEPNSSLSKPICFHADMVCHHLRDNKIIIAKGETELKKKLINQGFDVIESQNNLAAKYPNDVRLNTVRIGKYLFAGKTLDNILSKYCSENEIEIEFVNQGYVKCSTAVIDSNSIITSDTSIARAAGNAAIDVLKIEPGYISLEGCNYGFIGGCCGKIGKNKIAFTGSLNGHPDQKRIQDFIYRKNIEIIELTNHELIDIGGILPLKEYK